MNCRDCGQPSPTLVCQACFTSWEESLRRGHPTSALNLIHDIGTGSRCFADLRPGVSRDALLELARKANVLTSHLMSAADKTPEKKGP